MPHVHLLVATGTASRRLIASTLEALGRKGYEDVRRQEGGDWHALLTENRGGGLFDERSVIVVEDAERLGPMPTALAPLLEPQDASVTILLVAKSETPALVPKDQAKRCSLSKATEPSPWSKDRDDIVRAAAQEQGVSVSRDAVSLLKELFEDTGELASETKKLALACSLDGRREIGAPDVEGLCLSDGSRGLLRLLDGVCNGKQLDVLRSLDTLSANAELLPTLSALHNRIRLAYYTASHPRESAAFARALGARDYAARQAQNAARIYGPQKLRNFVIGLIRINANEKSGQGASWRDLHLLVIDLLSE